MAQLENSDCGRLWQRTPVRLLISPPDGVTFAKQILTHVTFL